jgi:hypothetical protein
MVDDLQLLQVMRMKENIAIKISVPKHPSKQYGHKHALRQLMLENSTASLSCSTR